MTDTRKAKRLYPALRERMRSNKFTQRKLSELLECSIPNVNMKLSGERQWKQKDIEILSCELGLTFEEIGRLFFYKRGQDQWADKA